MADLVVIGFPNEAKADEGNDSYRPVFSGNQNRTHESRMDKSTSPLSALVFAFALWAVMPPSIAAASTASDTVRGFYQTLLYNMQNGPSVGQQGRVARLAPVVPRVFDIPYMTQLAIGPTWVTLPEPQRRQVLQALRALHHGGLCRAVRQVLWRAAGSHRRATHVSRNHGQHADR